MRFDEGDVYGDGVNIAARLETIAPSGGLVVSGEAYDHLKNKVDVGYRDLGLQNLKNISTPVRAFEVTAPGISVPKRARRGGKLVAAIVVVVLLVGAGYWGWQAGFLADGATNAIAENTRAPRIAVLPFDRFDDSEDDGFTDGLVEDIITRLTYFDYQVIARNSSFQYRGQSVDIRQVGQDLNADYLLEGSVRSAAENIRVTAQLIDAATGDHVWAETYDRQLTAENVFEIQDEIAVSIASTIGGGSGEIARKIMSEIMTSRPKSLSGYRCTLLSRYIANSADLSKYPDVMECLRLTVEDDPEYSSAWAAMTSATYCASECAVCPPLEKGCERESPVT